METYTHHFEIRTNVLHFLAAMQGATVKRYDENGNVGQTIAVNYVYAPKSAILKDIVDKSNHISFPIVAVSMGGFRRANDRVKNKLDGYYKQKTISDSVYTKMRSPVPIDITFDLHAMSVYQTDLEQIITNWVAYFDPYIVVAWKEPYSGYELRSKIIWDGNGKITYPDQQTAAMPYRLELNASFTFEGWLFKAEPEEIGRICCIDTEWNVLSSQFCLMGDSIPWDADLETFHISGVPQIQRVEPITIVSNETTTMHVMGDFKNIKSVFVSANNSVMFDLSAFDYFPNDDSFPYFSGYPIQNFNVTDNSLIFPVTPLTAGRMDVVVVNDCGYSIMTQDMTSNPYSPLHPIYDIWNDAAELGISVIDRYALSCTPI